MTSYKNCRQGSPSPPPSSLLGKSSPETVLWGLREVQYGVREEGHNNQKAQNVIFLRAWLFSLQ